MQQTTNPCNEEKVYSSSVLPFLYLELKRREKEKGIFRDEEKQLIWKSALIEFKYEAPSGTWAPLDPGDVAVAATDGQNKGVEMVSLLFLQVWMDIYNW